MDGFCNIEIDLRVVCVALNRVTYYYAIYHIKTNIWKLGNEELYVFSRTKSYWYFKQKTSPLERDLYLINIAITVMDICLHTVTRDWCKKKRTDISGCNGYKK